MEQTITINYGSGIDALIGILVIVGAIIGYKRGVIVECIGFFAVFIVLIISANISKWLHTTLVPRSDVPDLFSTIFMTVCFILGLVFAVSKVTFRTQMMLQSIIMGAKARGLGALFGALKYYLISSVFLVTLYKIDEHASFLPDEAKVTPVFSFSTKMVCNMFPNLLQDKSGHELMDHPGDVKTGK